MPRGRLGNVTIPAISRIQLPQEIESSNLRELRNAVSGQDTAALGTIQQQLETFQPFDVEVNLHGFYAGHHFDGFLSGGTGEFYFSSIATNGVDVHDVSSQKLGGVFEKVAPGDWIDTKSLLLWPNTDGASQTTESLTLSFRLLERDDDAVAKKILAGLSKAAEAALEQYA